MAFLFSFDCPMKFPLLVDFWSTPVQFSPSVMSNSLQAHGLQHARPSCPSPTPGVYPNSCPLSQWCHPTISHPLSPSSPSAFNLSQHQGLFQWASSLHQVAKALDLQLQHQSFQWGFKVDFLSDWLVWFPHCLRDSQESSLAPQFKSISSSVLCLLYGPPVYLYSHHAQTEIQIPSQSLQSSTWSAAYVSCLSFTTAPLHTPLQPQWPSCCSSGKFIPTTTPSFFLHISTWNTLPQTFEHFSFPSLCVEMPFLQKGLP